VLWRERDDEIGRSGVAFCEARRCFALARVHDEAHQLEIEDEEIVGPDHPVPPVR
jgi:hypothetical protein